MFAKIRSTVGGSIVDDCLKEINELCGLPVTMKEVLEKEKKLSEWSSLTRFVGLKLMAVMLHDQG